MRIKTHRYTSLLAVLCLLIFSCPLLARTPGVPQAGSTEIGTVIPDGKDFRIVFNQEQLSRVAATQPSARRGPAGKEEVQQMIQSDVLRKLRILFPNGLPTGTSGTAGKVKITVTVKLTKPPEFGVSIEW